MKAALPALALTLAGCYHATALDARAVANELAAEQRELNARAVESTPIAASRTLTEDEAVALALRWNPDLRIARRQRTIAQGEVVAAGALANPTLELELLHVQDYGTRNAWGLELGWEPPQPVVYSARRAAATAQADAVAAEIVEAEWQLAVAVRVAHARVLAIGEQRGVVERALEGRRKIADLVDRRLGGGASTRLDLSLAQLAAGQGQRDLDDLAAAELTARQELSALIGAGYLPGATGAIPEIAEPPPAPDQLINQAITARAALRAEEKRFSQREQEVRAEHGRAWPWFRLTAAPRYRSDVSDRHPNDFMVGLQFTLPIFDQNQGAIAVAEGRRDEQRDQFRGRVGSLRREITTACDEIALYQRTLRRYRETVLPALESHSRLLSLAAGGGQLDMVALVTAEDAVLRSRRDYVDYRLAHYRAWLQLTRIVGQRVGTVAKAAPPAP